MRLGYACLAVGVPGTEQKSCMMKNATTERLMELFWTNLNALENTIRYNIRMNIRLFRISSGLIPFGSSPVNRLPWWDMYSSWLETIGNKIKSHGIRVSMHPGQYTIINSNDDQIVQRSFEDLNYHARVLDSLCLGPEHKLILHVGGIYGNKTLAAERFMRNFERLTEAVRNRLAIENDDKCFTAEDVLKISQKLRIPMVYDTLHNAVNPCEPGCRDADWICLCRETWREKDGPQKIHYSQQAPGKPPGSHAESIDTDEFLLFLEQVNNRDLDIMLEVKDKNLSVLKCMQAIGLKYGVLGKADSLSAI